MLRSISSISSYIWKSAIILFIFTVCFMANENEAANICMFTLGGSSSHKTMFYPIGEALARRGHNVTFYALFPPFQKVPGVTEIFLEETYLKLKPFLHPRMFSPEGPLSTAQMFPYGWTDFFEVYCRTCLESKEIQDLVKQDKVFDVCLLDGLLQDLSLPVVHQVSKSIVYVMPGDLVVHASWLMNNPYPFSYVPNFSFVSFSSKMTFLERTLNTVTGLGFLVFIKFLMIPSTDKFIQEYYPGLPTMTEAEKDVMFVLVNRHVALDYPIPHTPNIRDIGGVHVKDAEPLEKDLADFVEGSGEHGFIFVSFGTIVPEEDMPMYAKKAFIEAFSRIPQRVIWKYKLDIPGLSPNIKLVNWVSQQDLLGHPKARAFITHGGQFSIMETVFHGVPIVGIPVAFDQPGNIRRAEEMGFGVTLSWVDLNVDDVLSALNAVINDTSYKTNILKYQKRFKDNPISPLDEAVYWTEYAIRHQGSRHLRVSADHLNLAQYFLLDVLALVVLVLLIVLYVVYKLIRLCLRCVRKTGKSTKHQKSE